MFPDARRETAAKSSPTSAAHRRAEVSKRSRAVAAVVFTVTTRRERKGSAIRVGTVLRAATH